jgi:formylmethanofuran dehydrogenase subunit E
MAMPAFGCDPNAYTIRISGAVVAILRGGGCSFGIKVINAQKLGALAVVIVNTDDAKTMRLMALNDEIPQIQIPCLMASRRLQYFMQDQLHKYHLLGQHLISIQPTGLFGMYEERNTVAMPERIEIPTPPKRPPGGK